MKSDSTEKLIIEMETKALNKWADGSPSGYVGSFSPEVTYFDDIGAMNRIDGKKALDQYVSTLEGQVPKHKYDLVNPKVQVFGDVAILTLRYHPSSFQGDPLTQWRATCVYARENGDWRVVHSHWSMDKKQ